MKIVQRVQEIWSGHEVVGTEGQTKGIPITPPYASQRGINNEWADQTA